MEKLNVISNAGSEVRLPDHQEYITQNTKILNRKALKMHAWHLVSWLLRGAVISYLFYLGSRVVDGLAGKAIMWTAGFLLLYLLFYIWKGHQGVQRFRRAKIYWLLNDAAGNEIGSASLRRESQGQAHVPVQSQDSPSSRSWLGDHALS
jgi:hypothetical protein